MPRPAARTEPADHPTPGEAPVAITTPPVQTTDVDPSRATSLRSLFWQNVVREMLTALSVLQNQKPELFDGRTAVLTQAGERIPIAEVIPLFACGLPSSRPGSEARESAHAVECTVFRVRTPAGEVFTFPVSEVRAIHTLSAELIQQLEQASMQKQSADSAPGPFGFAAFTRAAREPSPGSAPQAPPASPAIWGPGLPPPA